MQSPNAPSVRNPVVLTCSHTFCLECFATWGKNKLPGQTLTCPLCRKKCTAPVGGFKDLPKNLFVARLLAMTNSAVGESNQIPDWCDVCYPVDGRKKKVAVVWCTNCDNYLRAKTVTRGRSSFRLTRSSPSKTV